MRERELTHRICSYHFLTGAVFLLLSSAATRAADAPANCDLRVGAAAVNLRCDASMVIAGSIEPRFTSEQEGQLRAVAVVIEKPGGPRVAIVARDVLWVPNPLAHDAL